MANLFDRFLGTVTDLGDKRSNEPTVDSDQSPLTQAHVIPKPARNSSTSGDSVSVNSQDGGNASEKQKWVHVESKVPDISKILKSESSFVIPKKKSQSSGILVDLVINSRDFQHEILPAIVKSYRNAQSANRFSYIKVQSVQNHELQNMYSEKRKELRNIGYAEKELGDCVAFLYVDTEEEMLRICRHGLSVGNYPSSCLGHPRMGVQLCKHADILRPVPLSSTCAGYLILFKIMKGRVKMVPENRSGNHLEPTPYFDCHISNAGVGDIQQSNSLALFESSQVYMYEYGEENILERPRNICPVAVVQFTCDDDVKEIRPHPVGSIRPAYVSAQRSNNVSNGSTVKDEDQEYVVWSGSLTVKGLYACSVEMRSTVSYLKPAKMGTHINITHKMDIQQVRRKYLHNVSKLSKHSESYWNGYSINVCELHPVALEGRSHFQRVMKYLGKQNSVAIQKLEKNVTLLMLTASELSYQLGLSKPHQYPVLLYCVFLSKKSAKTNVPSASKIAHVKTEQLHVSVPTNSMEQSRSSPRSASVNTTSITSPSMSRSPRQYSSVMQSPNTNLVSLPSNFFSPSVGFKARGSPSHSGQVLKTSSPSSPSSSSSHHLHPWSHGHTPVQSPAHLSSIKYWNSPPPPLPPNGSFTVPPPAPLLSPHQSSSSLPPSPVQANRGHNSVSQSHTPPAFPLSFMEESYRRTFQQALQPYSTTPPYDTSLHKLSIQSPPSNMPPVSYPGHHMPPSPHPMDPRVRNTPPQPMNSPPFPPPVDPRIGISLPPSGPVNHTHFIPGDPRSYSSPLVEPRQPPLDVGHTETCSWTKSKETKYIPSPSDARPFQPTRHPLDPRQAGSHSPRKFGCQLSPGSLPKDSRTGSPMLHSPSISSSTTGGQSSVPMEDSPTRFQVSIPCALPEPPKIKRILELPEKYDEGFVHVPPPSSLLQKEKLKKEFEDQIKTVELQYLAIQAVKQHLIGSKGSRKKESTSTEQNMDNFDENMEQIVRKFNARKKDDSKKSQGIKRLKSEVQNDIVSDASDMKHFLDSTLEKSNPHIEKSHPHIEKSRSQIEKSHSQIEKSHPHIEKTHSHIEKGHNQIEKSQSHIEKSHSHIEKSHTRKEKVHIQSVTSPSPSKPAEVNKEKQTVIEKGKMEKAEKGKSERNKIEKLVVGKDKANTKEFNLDFLEDITKMRMLTDRKIQKENERLAKLEQREKEKSEKITKKRSQDNAQEEDSSVECGTDEQHMPQSKKAKIDTANDMKHFLNMSLEEEDSQDSVSSNYQTKSKDIVERETMVTNTSTVAVNPPLNVKKNMDMKLNSQQKTGLYEEEVNVKMGSKRDKKNDKKSDILKDKSVKCEQDIEVSGKKISKKKNEVENVKTGKDGTSHCHESKKEQEKLSRWDSVTKKKERKQSSDAGSDGEGGRKVEKKKGGKIIIIKEIKMKYVDKSKQQDNETKQEHTREKDWKQLEKGLKEKAIHGKDRPLDLDKKDQVKKARKLSGLVRYSDSDTGSEQSFDSRSTDSSSHSRGRADKEKSRGHSKEHRRNIESNVVRTKEHYSDSSSGRSCKGGSNQSSQRDVRSLGSRSSMSLKVKATSVEAKVRERDQTKGKTSIPKLNAKLKTWVAEQKAQQAIIDGIITTSSEILPVAKLPKIPKKVRGSATSSLCVNSFCSSAHSHSLINNVEKGRDKPSTDQSRKTCTSATAPSTGDNKTAAGASVSSSKTDTVEPCASHGEEHLSKRIKLDVSDSNSSEISGKTLKKNKRKVSSKVEKDVTAVMQGFLRNVRPGMDPPKGSKATSQYVNVTEENRNIFTKMDSNKYITDLLEMHTELGVSSEQSEQIGNHEASIQKNLPINGALSENQTVPDCSDGVIEKDGLSDRSAKTLMFTVHRSMDALETAAMNTLPMSKGNYGIFHAIFPEKSNSFDKNINFSCDLIDKTIDGDNDDVYVWDTSRDVEIVLKDNKMRVTINNDAPLDPQWQSPEQLIVNCLHGHDDKRLSPDEIVQVETVQSVIHKQKTSYIVSDDRCVAVEGSTQDLDTSSKPLTVSDLSEKMSCPVLDGMLTIQNSKTDDSFGTNQNVEVCHKEKSYSEINKNGSKMCTLEIPDLSKTVSSDLCVMPSKSEADSTVDMDNQTNKDTTRCLDKQVLIMSPTSSDNRNNKILEKEVCGARGCLVEKEPDLNELFENKQDTFKKFNFNLTFLQEKFHSVIEETLASVKKNLDSLVCDGENNQNNNSVSDAKSEISSKPEQTVVTMANSQAEMSLLKVKKDESASSDFQSEVNDVQLDCSKTKSLSNMDQQMSEKADGTNSDFWSKVLNLPGISGTPSSCSSLDLFGKNGGGSVNTSGVSSNNPGPGHLAPLANGDKEHNGASEIKTLQLSDKHKSNGHSPQTLNLSSADFSGKSEGDQTITHSSKLVTDIPSNKDSDVKAVTGKLGEKLTCVETSRLENSVPPEDKSCENTEKCSSTEDPSIANCNSSAKSTGVKNVTESKPSKKIDEIRKKIISPIRIPDNKAKVQTKNKLGNQASGKSEHATKNVVPSGDVNSSSQNKISCNVERKKVTGLHTAVEATKSPLSSRNDLSKSTPDTNKNVTLIEAVKKDNDKKFDFNINDLVPVRSPREDQENKTESVNQKNVPSAQSQGLQSQAGPVRREGKKAKKKRHHPYQKKKRKNTWSFDIPYNSLQELMQNLTFSSYKQQNIRPKSSSVTSKRSYRCKSRFSNYKFVRSAVPDTLPESSADDSDDFTEDCIPNFEDRSQKANLLDQMTNAKVEDVAFDNEQNIYLRDNEQLPPSSTNQLKKDESTVKKTTERGSVQERLQKLAHTPVSSAKKSPSKDEFTKSGRRVVKVQAGASSSQSKNVHTSSSSTDPGGDLDLRNFINKMKEAKQKKNSSSPLTDSQKSQNIPNTKKTEMTEVVKPDTLSSDTCEVPKVSNSSPEFQYKLIPIEIKPNRNHVYHQGTGLGSYKLVSKLELMKDPRIEKKKQNLRKDQSPQKTLSAVKNDNLKNDTSDTELMCSQSSDWIIVDEVEDTLSGSGCETAMQQINSASETDDGKAKGTKIKQKKIQLKHEKNVEKSHNKDTKVKHVTATKVPHDKDISVKHVKTAKVPHEKGTKIKLDSSKVSHDKDTKIKHDSSKVSHDRDIKLKHVTSKEVPHEKDIRIKYVKTAKVPHEKGNKIKLDSSKVSHDKDIKVKHDTQKVSQDKDIKVKYDTPKVSQDKDIKVKHDTPKVSHDKDIKVKHDTPKVLHDKDIKVKHDTPKVSHDKDIKVKHDTPKVSHDKDIRVKHDTPKVSHDKDIKVKHDTPKVSQDKDIKVKHDTPKVSHDKDIKVKHDTPKVSQDKDTVKHVLAAEMSHDKNIKIKHITSKEVPHDKDILENHGVTELSQSKSVIVKHDTTEDVPHDKNINVKHGSAKVSHDKDIGVKHEAIDDMPHVKNVEMTNDPRINVFDDTTGETFKDQVLDASHDKILQESPDKHMKVTLATCVGLIKNPDTMVTPCTKAEMAHDKNVKGSHNAGTGLVPSSSAEMTRNTNAEEPHVAENLQEKVTEVSSYIDSVVPYSIDTEMPCDRNTKAVSCIEQLVLTKKDVEGTHGINIKESVASDTNVISCTDAVILHGQDNKTFTDSAILNNINASVRHAICKGVAYGPIVEESNSQNAEVSCGTDAVAIHDKVIEATDDTKMDLHDSNAHVELICETHTEETHDRNVHQIYDNSVEEMHDRSVQEAHNSIVEERHDHNVQEVQNSSIQERHDRYVPEVQNSNIEERQDVHNSKDHGICLNSLTSCDKSNVSDISEQNTTEYTCSSTGVELCQNACLVKDLYGNVTEVNTESKRVDQGCNDSKTLLENGKISAEIQVDSAESNKESLMLEKTCNEIVEGIEEVDGKIVKRLNGNGIEAEMKITNHGIIKTENMNEKNTHQIQEKYDFTLMVPENQKTDITEGSMTIQAACSLKSNNLSKELPANSVLNINDKEICQIRSPKNISFFIGCNSVDQIYSDPNNQDQHPSHQNGDDRVDDDRVDKEDAKLEYKRSATLEENNSLADSVISHTSHVENGPDGKILGMTSSQKKKSSRDQNFLTINGGPLHKTIQDHLKEKTEISNGLMETFNNVDTKVKETSCTSKSSSEMLSDNGEYIDIEIESLKKCKSPFVIYEDVDTDHQFEDIMSVIGNVPSVAIDTCHAESILSRYDLHSDASYLSTVAATSKSGPRLDPLEEAMLSSGILDLTTVPSVNISEDLLFKNGSSTYPQVNCDLSTTQQSDSEEKLTDCEESVVGDTHCQKKDQEELSKSRCSETNEKNTSYKKQVTNLNVNQLSDEAIVCDHFVDQKNVDPSSESTKYSTVTREDMNSSSSTDYVSDSELDSETKIDGTDLSSLIVSDKANVSGTHDKLAPMFSVAGQLKDHLGNNSSGASHCDSKISFSRINRPTYTISNNPTAFPGHSSLIAPSITHSARGSPLVQTVPPLSLGSKVPDSTFEDPVHSQLGNLIQTTARQTATSQFISLFSQDSQASAPSIMPHLALNLHQRFNQHVESSMSHFLCPPHGVAPPLPPYFPIYNRRTFLPRDYHNTVSNQLPFIITPPTTYTTDHLAMNAGGKVDDRTGDQFRHFLWSDHCNHLGNYSDVFLQCVINQQAAGLCQLQPKSDILAWNRPFSYLPPHLLPQRYVYQNPATDPSLCQTGGNPIETLSPYVPTEKFQANSSCSAPSIPECKTPSLTSSGLEQTVKTTLPPISSFTSSHGTSIYVQKSENADYCEAENRPTNSGDAPSFNVLDLSATKAEECKKDEHLFSSIPIGHVKPFPKKNAE